MAVKPIAYSYWRRIKDGARSFDLCPDGVKDDVRRLARLDVKTGSITSEQYKALVGEDYTV